MLPINLLLQTRQQVYGQPLSSVPMKSEIGITPIQVQRITLHAWHVDSYWIIIASGPDYYGFTHATIAKMIQDLPGAANCINYVWQTFGEMHQKTAAGVAAASLRKLTNLEIMGSANKRAPQDGENEKQEEPAAATTTADTQPKIEKEPSTTTQSVTGSAIKHEDTAMRTD